MDPVRWHSWHLAWKIGAMSLVNVTCPPLVTSAPNRAADSIRNEPVPTKLWNFRLAICTPFEPVSRLYSIYLNRCSQTLQCQFRTLRSALAQTPENDGDCHRGLRAPSPLSPLPESAWPRIPFSSARTMGLPVSGCP